MGLLDRDYMHDKQRKRMFSPPPRPFDNGALGIALVFILTLFFLYKVADWKLKPQAAQRPMQVFAEPALQSVAQPMPAPALAMPAHQSAPNAAERSAKVTKCVINGSTSYGDSTCLHGAVISQITTRTDHNLIAAVRLEPTRRAEAPAAPRAMTLQTPPFDDAAAKKSVCQGLDEQIKQWDAMARQPQSGQIQDWIRAQRRQAPDRQFRLHCA